MLAEDLTGEATSMALGSQEPNKHGLYAEFYMNTVPDPKRSEEEGRPIFKDSPYIMIMVPGDKSSVIRRPIRTGQNPLHDNNRFHNEYVAFMQQAEQPIEGMPLAEWPQVTRSQVLELNHFGIKTVEHLANLADSNAQKFMGIQALKQKAKIYLEATKSDKPIADLQAKLEERDNEVDTLKNTVEEMGKELKKLKTGR